MTVVVSSPNYSVNNVATFFGKLMKSVFGLRFQMLPSLEAAYARLQEVDPTLADLEPIAQNKPDLPETQPIAEDENTDTQPVLSTSSGKHAHS